MVRAGAAVPPQRLTFALELRTAPGGSGQADGQEGDAGCNLVGGGPPTRRPAGAPATRASRLPPIVSVPFVRVGPVLTVVIRTPWGPYSAAHAFVSIVRAAFVEP